MLDPNRGWRDGCAGSRRDSYGEKVNPDLVASREGKTGTGLSPDSPPGKQSVRIRSDAAVCDGGGKRRRVTGGGPERAERSQSSRQTADSRTLPRPAVKRFCFRRGNSQLHGVAAAQAWLSAQRDGRLALRCGERIARRRLRGARCGVVLRYTAACKATRRVGRCRTLWRRRLA